MTGGTLDVNGSIDFGANGCLESAETCCLRLARHWRGAGVGQDAVTRQARVVFDGGGVPTPDLGSGAFFIEAEDFNYDRGQHDPVADVMPYGGGAYEGRAGRDRIDYSQTINQAFSDLYRLNEGPGINVNIYPMSELARGQHLMNVNYKLGYNDATEWFNYSRVYPAQLEPSYFFARLSSGSLPNALQVDEITGSASTTSQSLAKLGEVRGPASGDWNRFIYVPLRGEGGDLVSLNWSGQKIFRVTILEGGSEDIDCLLLAPASTSGPGQLFEVMGQDFGANASGFDADTCVASLSLAENSIVRLIDETDNAAGPGAEALYVTSLVVPAGATLDLSGFSLYATEIQIDGTVIGGTIQQVTPPAPQLSIQIEGESVELSWAANAGGYTLHYAEAILVATTWTEVTTAPTTVNDRKVVVETRQPTMRLYRLQRD
jgi:hypothetical protein